MDVRVAVVGGGITGLAAALRLRDRLPRARITVFDQATRLGGKLATGPLGESGAENFLARDPSGGESAAVALTRRVGLGDELVHPRPVPAAVVVDGQLRPLPPKTLLGVPSELSTVESVARPVAALDRDEGRPLLSPGDDPAVGALVRARLGDDVVDRLVDPLLGGVYAGRADLLSLLATMPGLAAAALTEPTLVGAARAAIAASAAHRGTGPVFATVQSGLSTLVDAVVRALGPVDFRLGQPVRALDRTADGWRLTTGPAARPEYSTVDGVVLAVPAGRAHRLWPAVPPVEYASVALVTLALPEPRLPELSGFLVPAVEHRAVKAVTFFGHKWAHQGRPDGVALVRASLGRYGETEILHRTDDELAATVHAELSGLVGPMPAPVATTVTRWGGALPQYAPGHVERVARTRAALPPTLALAGAGYDGVGIPACIRSGEVAADRIALALGESST